MIRMNGKPTRVLQITDSHLGRSAGESLLGINTADTLNDILAQASSNPRYDLVLSTGDISNDGTSGSYDRFVQAVKRYFPGIPLAWLEGNHDDPASMRAMLSEQPLTDYLEIGPWRLILLNSRIPFEEGGELAQRELDRMEALLESAPDAPTMIFLHHQPIPVGSAWIDQYVVKNARSFFSITDRFSNIRAISWGHVHQEFHMQRNGVDLIATPSTCLQFKPGNDDFMVDDVMPAYREYVLNEDGSYSTAITRVETHTHGVDLASSGY